jgi:hypothetical protein
MRALPGQRIEIQRQCRDERLSLAGRHFCDLPEVQLDPTHELHVVWDHVPRQLVPRDHDFGPDEAAAGLTNGRERLGQDLVEHFRGLAAELGLDAAAAIRSTQLVVDALPVCRIRCDALPLA